MGKEAVPSTTSQLYKQERYKQNVSFPFYPCRSLTTYFPSFHLTKFQVLTVVLPFGTLMGAWTPSMTERYQGQRVWLKQSQGFKRQLKTQAELIEKFHLLCETTLSRLGKVAVFSNVQNQKQREWRKLKEHRTLGSKEKNKIKLQKQTLHCEGKWFTWRRV